MHKLTEYSIYIRLKINQLPSHTMIKRIFRMTIIYASKSALITSLIILNLILATACSKENKAKPTQKDQTNPKPRAENNSNKIPRTNYTKIKFKKPGGATAFILKPQDNGLKLVDGFEREIARINLTDNGQYKSKDSTDKVLAYVTGNGPKFQIKNAVQDQTLFSFQQQKGGDWKLKDGEETLLCKIEKRDYGWKIEDTDQKPIGKVKLENGRTTLRDGDENDLFHTNDSINPIATTPFLIPQLSQAQAATLSAALIKIAK